MSETILSVEDISSDVLAENIRHDYPVAHMLGRIQVLPKVSYEGKIYRVLKREVQDGDLYFSGRNIQRGVNGVRLLKAKEVDHKNGWVIAEPFAYAFDIWECVPVEEI